MNKIYIQCKIVLFALLLMLPIVVACSKEEVLPVVPEVITSAAYDITENSFSIKGTIVTNGDAAISGRGICWGTDPNPTIDGSKLEADNSSGEFSLTVTGLKSGTTYYFRTYVTTASGTEYGDQRNVITQGQLAYTLPFVERFLGGQFLPAYWSMIDHDGDDENWYAYTSRFRGAISDSWSGGALTPYNFLVTPKITMQGSQINLSWNVGATHHSDFAEHYKVVVSEQPFTEANCTSIGTVVFEETLTATAARTLVLRTVSLSSYVGKDIYVAWIHFDCSNEDGLVVTDMMIESSEQPIVTAAPTFGALAINNVTPVSANVSATIPNDGGLSVIRRGFCYSKVSPATLDDIVVEVAVTSATAAAFSADLNMDRDETYFVKAFAVNAEGISYSNEVSVTTPLNDKTVLFFEDFALGISDFGWTFIDMDGDGKGWTYYADDEDQCARSRSYESGSALTPENYMVMPPIDLPADAMSLELSFLVAAAASSDFAESYAVLLSLQPVTKANCQSATVIKPLETLTAANRSWTFTDRSVDLTAYKGQTVYIIFVHKDCTDMASLLIDDIEVSSFK